MYLIVLNIVMGLRTKNTSSSKSYKINWQAIEFNDIEQLYYNNGYEKDDDK
jgi:hypothetical protein